MEAESTLWEAILALQRGERERAGALLVRYTRQNPQAADGWLWLSRCLDDPQEVNYCLRKARALDPVMADAFQAEVGKPLGQPAGANAQQAGAQRRLRLKLPKLSAPAKRAMWGVLALLFVAAGVGLLAWWNNWQTEKGKSAQRILTADRLVIGCGQNCDYAGAVPVLDEVLRYEPGSEMARRLRAAALLGLGQSRLESAAAVEDLRAAVGDIDRAIRAGPPDGEEYLTRYRIYRALAERQETRADRLYLSRTALENLQTAVQLGVSDPLAARGIPELYYQLGMCAEGDEALLLQQDAQPPDEPSPSLEALAALGLVTCAGDLEGALIRIEESLDIYPDGARAYQRALILYARERPEEALTALDDLLDAQPEGQGERYYLRALLLYEQGLYDLANEDLLSAISNTWERGGLYLYLQALTELDTGDPEEGVRLLQQAEAALPGGFYTPLGERLRDELADLGSQPLEPKVTVRLKSTPIVIYED